MALASAISARPASVSRDMHVTGNDSSAPVAAMVCRPQQPTRCHKRVRSACRYGYTSADAGLGIVAGERADRLAAPTGFAAWTKDGYWRARVKAPFAAAQAVPAAKTRLRHGVSIAAITAPPPCSLKGERVLTNMRCQQLPLPRHRRGRGAGVRGAAALNVLTFWGSVMHPLTQPLLPHRSRWGRGQVLPASDARRERQRCC